MTNTDCVHVTHIDDTYDRHRLIHMRETDTYDTHTHTYLLGV